MPPLDSIVEPSGDIKAHAYPLASHEGHLIVEAGSHRLLIDTGSPVSIGLAGIEFAGETMSSSEQFLGLSTEELSGYVGTPIDALIGMDVLFECDVRIDLTAGRLDVTRQEFCLGGAALPISFVCSVPLLEASLPMKPHARLLLDTGAPLSYLRRELTEALTPHAQMEDFHPGLGRFTTPIYRQPLKLGNRTHSINFGVLPQLLEKAMLACSVDGIVGSELLIDGAVVLASRRGSLEFVSPVCARRHDFDLQPRRALASQLTGSPRAQAAARRPRRQAL